AFAGLLDGPHTLDLRATDAAGNRQATPTTHAWTIDTVAPQILGLDVQPTVATDGDTVTISFTTDESVTTPSVTLAGLPAVVVLDGGTTFSFSHAVTAGDPEGMATVIVTVADAAGNSATAYGATTLDFTPPDTLLGPALPADPTNLT